MKSPDEVSEEQLGPPIVPRGLSRRVVFALAALPLVALIVYAIALNEACASCSPDPSPDVASPVDGVVVAVDSSGLADVRGFTLRVSQALALEFVLGPLENATEFSPSHLAEHQATSEPIRVWFRVEDGTRVVYRLEDAPGLRTSPLTT